MFKLLDSLGEEIILPGVYYLAELPSSSQNCILQQVKKDAIVWNFDTTTAYDDQLYLFIYILKKTNN